MGLSTVIDIKRRAFIRGLAGSGIIVCAASIVCAPKKIWQVTAKISSSLEKTPTLTGLNVTGTIVVVGADMDEYERLVTHHLIEISNNQYISLLGDYLH